MHVPSHSSCFAALLTLLRSSLSWVQISSLSAHSSSRSLHCARARKHSAPLLLCAFLQASLPLPVLSSHILTIAALHSASKPSHLSLASPHPRSISVHSLSRACSSGGSSVSSSSTPSQSTSGTESLPSSLGSGSFFAVLPTFLLTTIQGECGEYGEYSEHSAYGEYGEYRA